ncbi:MAG: hypothetical protein M3391_01960 [Actinomycetota bacterium]|nr:hypothetical protein [Actinomycetota bacterium]
MTIVIVRTWRGATRPEDVDRYVDYMKLTGLKQYRETEGNLGAMMLLRPLTDAVEVLIISLWDSLDAVRRFAGDDYEQAVFYPEDDDFLVDRDLHVTHHEVAAARLPFLDES